MKDRLMNLITCAAAVVSNPVCSRLWWTDLEIECIVGKVYGVPKADASISSKTGAKR